MAQSKEGGGLDRWMVALVDHRLASPRLVEEFHQGNNNKEAELRRWRLPQLAHYGTFASLAAIKSQLANLSNPHLIVRAKCRASVEVKRLIGTDLAGVCTFVEELPGGIDAWVVEVKEYDANTVASGTIVISPSGELLVEAWYKGHLNVQSACPKLVGKLDSNNLQRPWVICWSETEGVDEQLRDDCLTKSIDVDERPWVIPLSAVGDAEDLKVYAMRALRYHCPHLRPRVNDPIYLEFCIRENGNVYFIDVSDSPLLTGRG